MEFSRRGSHPAGPSSRKNPIECGYCGKLDHYDVECRKKQRESTSTSRQLTNYATNSDYDDHGGVFAMRHKAHLMSAQGPTNTSSSDDVWFVDSGASNHVTSHKDWFRELRKPDLPGYVETGDDTTHSIRHIRNAPFGNDDKQTYLKKLLHVPTIMKNLVSVG